MAISTWVVRKGKQPYYSLLVPRPSNGDFNKRSRLHVFRLYRLLVPRPSNGDFNCPIESISQGHHLVASTTPQQWRFQPLISEPCFKPVVLLVPRPSNGDFNQDSKTPLVLLYELLVPRPSNGDFNLSAGWTAPMRSCC